MRQRVPLVMAAAAVSALVAMGPTLTTAAPVDAGDRTTTLERLGLQQVPKQRAADVSARGAFSVPGKGTNPYIGLLPDLGEVDWAYWKDSLARGGAARAAQASKAPSRATAAEPLLVDEAEPDLVRGSNDTPATGQLIPSFGTGRRERPAARVLGTLAAPAPATAIGPSVEDDGAIPLANDGELTSSGSSTASSGTVGDGPHGSTGDGTGDFDFFAFPGLTAGQNFSIDVDTPTGSLDSIVVLYDAAGTPLAANDDEDGLDSKLSVTVPADGDYFVAVLGFAFFSDPLPTDPFDSGSGNGVGSEGPYLVTFGLDASDLDFYTVTLDSADILGGSVTGAGTQVAVYDPAGRLVIGSGQDASSIYPVDSPLPGGGNAVFAHVADEPGQYSVLVTGGTGNYDLTLEAYRPGLERQGGRPTQTIFLDFDGQRTNTAIFGGPGVVQLSPLSAFLAPWGLTAADEDAVIDEIIATTVENVRTDLASRGLAVRILNSRDHADPFGRPNVSRIIVGGTIAESGVPTIGIAQSIDPGNFETEETALVLLDVLSGDPADDASLNFYLTPESDRIGFVGQAVGNVVSHEAGHYLGSFHVDQFNAIANLMNQGGANFGQLFGVGPDGIGGTADDIDTDFGEDVYNPNEGYTGIEDTAANTRGGLTNRR